MLLIALLLSEREGRGGGWRDNVKEARGVDRGGTVHCTALIIALKQRWEKQGRE